MRCPDGIFCGNRQTCCPNSPSRRIYLYCPNFHAICCPDYITCCPRGWICSTTLRKCLKHTYSSAFQMQTILLINSTDKPCRDGTAGMGPKVISRITPLRQEETALKRSSFIGTSGDVFSPDEKYQCPDGTSTCELSSGIYGCCPIQNARWVKIMDTIPPPHSSDGM